ncbi:MAG: hypothetical protein ABSH11_06480 [Verrucomicrobiota bacterium]
MNTASQPENWRRWFTVAAGLVAAMWLAAVPATRAEDTNAVKTAAVKPALPAGGSDAASDLNNWVTLGAGGTLVDGDRGQFLKRQQLPNGAFGGIEDFHLEQKVGKKGMFQANGRGIIDNHDYLVDLELAAPDKGFVRGGFEEFRTWYDGSGGYFPGGTNRWQSLYDDELAIDRGRAWFEAGLTLPDLPLITFRYEHAFRNGEKNSTIWGDASVVDTPGVWPPPTATSPTTRNFVPTFLGIDEKRDKFSLDLKHAIGNTAFGVGASYEMLDNNNTRNIHRRPGEITGANAQQSADRYVVQRDKLDEDSYNIHGFTATRFNDKVKLTLGGSYTKLDTDVGGSRIYGNSYDLSEPPVNYLRSQQRDEGFYNLAGGAHVEQYVANLNLMFTPVENLVVVPSLRVEKQDTEGRVELDETTVNTAGGPVVPNGEPVNLADRDFLEVTEALEVRYTGIRNVSLYARGQWSETCGSQMETVSESDTVDFFRNNDWQHLVQKYTLGANWYPLRKLNFGGQYYYKSSAYDYHFLSDPAFYHLSPTTNTSDFYPLFIRAQNFDTHDLNFRAHWHPFSTLSLVGRYDFQYSTVHTRGDVNSDGIALSDEESAEITSQIISGSINWTPLNRLYLQLGASYAFDNTFQTPAAGALGFTNAVPNLSDNYWTANAMVGYLLNDKTDLQIAYYFFRADNYVNNSTYSQPFGTSNEEQGITATLTRQINRALRLSLKYGFFRNRDDTSGGYNNYDSHLIFASMQYRF